MIFTPAQIAARLTPHIGGSINPASQTHWVNISCGRHHRLNADIRLIDDRGVGVFLYSGIEYLPFETITHISIKREWHGVERPARDALAMRRAA